ncbi:MAG: PEGA domain-containing protein, partial [Myxococcota bacterium]
MRLHSPTTGRAAALALLLTLAHAGGARGAGMHVAGVAVRGDAAQAEGTRLAETVRAALKDRGVPLKGEAAEGGITADEAKAALPEVDALVTEGEQRFYEADYRACITALENALQKYDRGPAHFVSHDRMANGLLLLAQAYEKSGQKAKAKSAYQTLVSRWPDHEPDPNAFPPAVLEAVGRARNEQEKAGLTLTVETTPSGAQVFVDGAARGKSPARLEGLGAGAHHVRVELQGAVRTAVVSLKGAETLQLQLGNGPGGKLVEALAGSRPEAACRKAAVTVGKETGATSVVAGVLLTAPEADPPRLLLARFDAPDGAPKRVVGVDLPLDADEGELVGLAIDALTQPDAPVEAVVEGGEVKAGKGARAVLFPGGK